MRVEVIPAGGLGGRQPLVTQAHQVVVFGDLGTPIAVVYDDGAGNIEFSHARMNDFNEILRRCGINGPVVQCDAVDVPRPLGRRITT